MNDKYALISLAWLFTLSILIFDKSQPLVTCYNNTVDKIVLTSGYELPRIKVEKKIKGKMVEVTEKLKFAPYGSCSAVLVREDGVILTAAHCTARTSLVRVETAQGHVYRAAVIAKDKVLDLALLKIVPTPQERFSVAKIGTIRPVGWPVYVVGNPNDLRFIITSGIISGYNEQMVVSDATIQHGSSGGGLFDIETGNLLGVTHAMVLDSMFGGFAGISLFVRTDDIQRFLERNLPLCG